MCFIHKFSIGLRLGVYKSCSRNVMSMCFIHSITSIFVHLFDDLRFCSCLEMASSYLSNLCKCTILLRSSLISLNFHIGLSIGHFSECCQTDNFNADKWKLPVVVSHDGSLCLVKLKHIVEPSAPLMNTIK